MTPIESEIRRLIAEETESGRSLRSIAKKAKLGYFKLYNWHRGRSPNMDVAVADKLYRSLGGKGFTK